MPLGLRRLTLILAYWVNLQEHNEFLPAKNTQKCWEHSKSNFRSFGWVVNKKAREVGLNSIQYCPTVRYSNITLKNAGLF